jgi:O-antigen/teichoic acid export membrane protein
LPMLFGATYRSARWIFVILVFGFAIQGWIQVVVSLLYALRRSRDVALLSVTYLLAAVSLEAAFILEAGGVGAALGILASSVLMLLATLRVAWRATAGDGNTERSRPSDAAGALQASP